MENDNVSVNENADINVTNNETESEVEQEAKTEEKTKNNNKEADSLCAISALLMYPVFYALTKLTGYLPLAIRTNIPLIDITNILVHMVPLAGFIMMIILRVKYPKHIGGKVLMWLTIAVIVAIVAFWIYMAIICGKMVDECANTCCIE